MEPMDVVTTQTKKRKLAVTTKIPVPRNIRQYVNRAINRNEELKYFDTILNNTASSVSFLGYDLLRIPQGVTRNTRVGDVVRIKRVQIKCEIQPGDHYNLTRFLVGTNVGAVPNSTSGIISALRTSGTTDDTSIWTDKFAVPFYQAAVGNAADQAMRPVEFNLDRKVNWLVNFFSSATADPQNRQLWIQFHSDSVAIPHPGIYGYARVWYTDA